LSSTEINKEFPHKIKFTPSLDEQVLLEKILRQHCLIQYKIEEKLFRILSLIISYYISKEKNQNIIPRVLILTKRQIQDIFKASLQENLDQIFTIHNGQILPHARKIDYNRFSIILSTPKIVKNDFRQDYFVRNHFSLIIIDYAEMGVSSSSLRFIIQNFNPTQVIGLTRERNDIKLEQACINLELMDIIRIDGSIRREESTIQHYSLPLPKEYYFVLDILDQIKKNKLKELESLGFRVSIKSTLQEIAAIHNSLLNEKSSKALVKTANLQRIITMQRKVISQGFPAFLLYFDELQTRLGDNNFIIGRKALVEFVTSPLIKKLMEYTRLFPELDHPKFNQVIKIIEEYQTGISIITNLRNNAEFLEARLNAKGIPTTHITQPISSYTHLQIEKKLFGFSGGKTRVCITNSINDLIAGLATIIIAYDVNADIFEKLNHLSVPSPRIVLITKQTSEEARFFHLKNLGSGVG
jgi:ERCC4-related helicase